LSGRPPSGNKRVMVRIIKAHCRAVRQQKFSGIRMSTVSYISFPRSRVVTHSINLQQAKLLGDTVNKTKLRFDGFNGFCVCVTFRMHYHAGAWERDASLVTNWMKILAFGGCAALMPPYI